MPMSKPRHTPLEQRRIEAEPSRFSVGSRLTPGERRALLLTAGLFALGFLVRWYRLALR